MKKLATVILTGLLIMVPLTTYAQNIKMFKEPPFEFYKVTKGDSFWFIAQRYGLDYKELMRINPGVDPYNMQIGSNIRLMPENKHSPSTGDLEKQVAQLVNTERARHNLKPLQLRSDLSKVAETKSRDMKVNNYFSHNSPTYGTPFNMLKRFGITYQYAGENIAAGQSAPAQVMRDWMNSPGHRKNILSPNYDSIGVGEYENNWTQIFTGGR